MRALVLIGLLLTTQPAVAAQSREDAYAACLVGNAVILKAGGAEPSAALDQAISVCDSLSLHLPAAPGDEGTGPEMVQERVVHLLDNEIWANSCPLDTVEALDLGIN